jgi:transcriptional regulator with XRE-family HTH domain
MHRFGKVIRHFREEQNLTRNELSDGICHSQYLYMIERGERNPSFEVLEMIFSRLNIKWLQYLYFLEMDNPVEYEKDYRVTVKAFEDNDMETIRLIFNKYKDELDKYPLTIQYHTFYSLLYFKRGEYREVIDYLEDMFYGDIDFSNLDNLSSYNVFYQEAIVIYARALHKLDDDQGLKILYHIKDLFMKNTSFHLINHYVYEIFQILSDVEYELGNYYKVFELTRELKNYCIKNGYLNELLSGLIKETKFDEHVGEKKNLISNLKHAIVIADLLKRNHEASVLRKRLKEVTI